MSSKTGMGNGKHHVTKEKENEKRNTTRRNMIQSPAQGKRIVIRPSR
jgi:hypothetical protein